MKCPNCNHVNEEAKFCERCGGKLNNSATNQIAATTDAHHSNQGSSSTSIYLDKTKTAITNYFGYSIQVLKNPYPVSSNLGKEYFVNALITMILYAFIIPSILYFSLKGVLSEITSQLEGNIFGSFITELTPAITPSFADVVAKPFFGFVLLIGLVSVFTFTAIKLGKVIVDIKEVIARFGAFLLPFVAILIVSLLLSILKVKFSIAILAVGFVSSLLLVPAFVISSYKKGSKEGLDVLYGSILCYVLTVIVLVIMGNFLFESVLSSLQHFLSSFGF